MGVVQEGMEMQEEATSFLGGLTEIKKDIFLGVSLVLSFIVC